MSDTVIIFNAFFALLSTCFTGFLAYKFAELNKFTNSVNTKLDDSNNIGLSNHNLLNSAKRALLKSNMDFAERFARQADATEGDKSTARAARDEYEEHEKAQAQVDANSNQTTSINRVKAS